MKELEGSENPSHIQVMKFRTSFNIEEHFVELNKPKIVLDCTSLGIRTNNAGYQRLVGLNYLNLPQTLGTPTLKHNFNHSFLTIILIEKISKLPVTFIEWFLLFSKLSTILIISNNEKAEDLNRVLKMFYTMKFTNVLHLDIGSFEATQMITRYESFPEYNSVSRGKFEKENTKNIRKKKVPIAFVEQKPYCILIKDKDNTSAVGILSHFYKTFVKFVNGTLIADIKEPKTAAELSEVSLPKLHEFVTSNAMTPFSTYQANYRITAEINSDDIYFLDIIIVVPKSKPTKKELYLVKIFSIEIWMLTLIFVVFASGAFSLYQMIFKQEITFWRTFGQVFRSSLAQSFPGNRISSLMIATFFMITILFGYILTTWFNAILGSFVTTTLFDRQARTLEDFRTQNIQIAWPKLGARSRQIFASMNEIQDLIIEQEIFDEGKAHAKVVSEHVWDYVIAPVENKIDGTSEFVKSDIIVERSFVRVKYKIDSVFKEQINRFIGLVKDVGLYQHWCDIAPKEILESLGNPSAKQEQNPIQVLQLNFFTYAFYIWFLGLFLSCISFVFEIEPRNILKFMKRNLKLLTRRIRAWFQNNFYS